MAGMTLRLYHPPPATPRSSITMSNEWRISRITIEAEMLRLATLLSVASKSGTVHPGLARHEVRAANVSLRSAVNAVAANL